MKLDPIINEISVKTGISHDQSRAAFMASLEYIKTKLPESVGSQLTGILDGKPFDYNVIVKEKLNEIKDDAEVKLDTLRDETKIRLEELRDSAKNLIDKFFQQTK